MLSNYARQYFDTVQGQLERLFQEQGDLIHRVAVEICEAFHAGHNIFTFGPGHAGMFAEELFYRAGGLVFTNPLFHPGLSTSVRPITLSSDLELVPGFPAVFVDESPMREGDILLLHSVAGSTPIAIETALRAREKGVKVFAIICMDYASKLEPVIPGEPMLYEACDAYIDTCGVFGDACVKMSSNESVPAVGPTSSILASMIGNLITVEVCSILLSDSPELPVFKSGHVDGGTEYNFKLLEQYKDHIFYM